VFRQHESKKVEIVREVNADGCRFPRHVFQWELCFNWLRSVISLLQISVYLRNSQKKILE